MISQPEKLATPLTGVRGLVVQPKVAPLPGWLAMARLIDAFELVTTLPKASSTLTDGWLVQTAPSAPPPGGLLKTSFVAVPKVMLKFELVAEVSPAALAVRL